MNTADYIVKKLEELSVNVFFGISGKYNFNILQSIENNQNTKFIGCTNELNAGYAADGYARVKGYGALVTTYGAGELKTVNAVAGCNAENIPIVHIVGLPCTKLLDKNNIFLNVFKSITASATLLTRDNAKIETDRIFKVLVKEKRPVYIAIPEDIAEMEISDRYVSNDWMSNTENLDTVANKIAEKINNAVRPVIIGDILIKRFDAQIEFNEFVSKSGIPVTNLITGVNIVDADYEKYIGGYYGKYKNPIAEKYVKDSDCVISVGTTSSDFNILDENFSKNKDIAIYGTYAYIDGKWYDDIKMSELLEAVTKKIEPKDIDADKPNIGYKQKLAGNELLTSDYIYPRLQDFFKENDIIFAETGTVPYGICGIKFPQSCNVQFQLSWGAIGWATPAALGANLAKPESRVILITGDGAHQMSCIEIGNMLRFGIKPIVIVINNGEYTMNKAMSKNNDNDFNNIVKMNYSKFARIFDGDVWSTKTNTTEDFDKALKVTQIMNKMCYIEACTQSFDMPLLAQDFVSDVTGKILNNVKIDYEKTNEDNKKEEIKETITISQPIKYETVVHQSLTNKNSGENNE